MSGDGDEVIVQRLGLVEPWQHSLYQGSDSGGDYYDPERRCGNCDCQVGCEGVDA